MTMPPWDISISRAAARRGAPVVPCDEGTSRGLWTVFALDCNLVREAAPGPEPEPEQAARAEGGAVGPAVTMALAALVVVANGVAAVVLYRRRRASVAPGFELPVSSASPISVQEWHDGEFGYARVRSCELRLQPSQAFELLLSH